MANIVYELMAKIGLDDKEYQDKLTGAGNTLKSWGSKAGKLAFAGAKVIGAGIAAGAAGVATLTKQAVESYAEYEQLVGGVETLFGAGGMSLEEYANSVGKTVDEVRGEYDSLMSAQKTVMKNAGEAYKTAGLSANEYMETVTSFSASLIQSLGGDTEKAAAYADKAIIDMSDNANKMGTDMSAIQTAYQGFAKQNYTMLDNLKLGYGGTKTEMERLVADAEKLDSSFKAQRDSAGNLTLSYADVVDAIHIVQDNMGITDTTAREASTTIQGSVGAMRAAWANLVTGMADDNADITKLIDDLVTTIIGENGEGGVINNILPAVERALDGIATFITTAAPKLVPMAVNLILVHLPDIISAGTQIIVALITGLAQALPQLVRAIPDILKAIVGAFRDGWPQIKEAGIELLKMLGNGILDGWNWVKEKLHEIVEKIKGVFDFDWHFPKPKLPHFSVNWRDLGIISIPDISIEWYKKAYDNPYMFTKPTVMGFGDGVGGEMVYGHQSLLNDIKTAMRDTMGSEQPITIIVQSVLDGKVIGETATKWQRRQARAFG